MTTATAPALVETPEEGVAPPSPAGPLDEPSGLPLPPQTSLPRPLQRLRVTMRQIEFVFRARRELGAVFRIKPDSVRELIAVTSHPDHVKSLFRREGGAGPFADRRVAAAADR